VRTVVEIEGELTGFKVANSRERLQESSNLIERSGRGRFGGYSLLDHDLDHSKEKLLGCFFAG
jgi:hypothetical protein